MKKTRFPRLASAFTLIELLVVITIIAVLAGFTFTGVQTAMLAAKKMQAKNDMMQLVNAVTSYYTEYGQYPNPDSKASDTTFGDSSNNSSKVVNVLRCVGTGTTNNTRQVQFIQPKVLDTTSTTTKGAVCRTDGNWYDPWGVQYLIFEDLDYDGAITVTSQFADIATQPNFGVGTASVGYYYALQKSTTHTSGGNLTTTNVTGKKSILLSWQ